MKTTNNKTSTYKSSNKKTDHGKLEFHDMPLIQLEKITKVFNDGMKKYGENNWTKSSKAEGLQRYKNALFRHALKYVSGETIDQESGHSHASHIACNAMMLLHFEDLKEELSELGRN